MQTEERKWGRLGNEAKESSPLQRLIYFGSCCNWNHYGPEYAPHAQLPEASDITAPPGACSPSTDIIDMPFHVRRNVLHHAKSALKDALMRIWCHGFLASLASTIIRLKNERPGFTTLVACWSWPISESNSCFVQDFLPSQLCSSVSSRCSFSSGSLISPFVVSNSNPRYSRQL